MMQPPVYSRLSARGPQFQPMVNSDFVERIHEAITSAGYSWSSAAVAIGLSSQAPTKWKKGQIGKGTLEKLAALTGYSVGWLMSGSGHKLQNDYLQNALSNTDEGAAAATPEKLIAHLLRTDTPLSIPQYNTGGMGGNGLVLRDQPGIIENWSVSREWLRANVPYCTSPENLCLVTGFGDSMPDTFNPGDPVLIDKGIAICDHDGVFFFRVGNEGFIKRLQRVPGVGIRAISQNKDYETWTITPDMDFEVFGKVLKAWKGKNY